ncbi:MAG: RCC1 domain-containing protein [Oscillospiraceae bacterium]|nr:RCC1 domain-containing protein [Oscillospiraceae bacterium]
MDFFIKTAGNIHNLAIKSDGSLWTWGNNHYGQLGYNTTNTTLLSSIKIMDDIMIPNRPSSWAASQVDAAIAAGIVPANLQSRYTQPATRAEVSALAVALYEKAMNRAITERVTFNDTTDINVQKAAAIRVMSAPRAGYFMPNDNITREDSATALVRLASAIGKPLPAAAPNFPDNSRIGSWARDAVGQVAAVRFMTAVPGGNFNPKANFTIEECIVAMWRLYNR